MGALEKTVDTPTWLKIEPESWVRPAGWAGVALSVLIWPIRMYPFYWATGMQIESIYDPIILGCISVFSVITGSVLLSQPRLASAEQGDGVVEIERGFATVIEERVAFSDVRSVDLGRLGLCPLLTTVLIRTDKKKSVFVWSTDGGEAKAIAEQLRSIILPGGGAAASDPAAANPDPTAS